jgi:hypothetical protein
LQIFGRCRRAQSGRAVLAKKLLNLSANLESDVSIPRCISQHTRIQVSLQASQDGVVQDRDACIGQHLSGLDRSVSREAEARPQNKTTAGHITTRTSLRDDKSSIAS